MKTYRILTLFAALLITALEARALTDEKVGADQAHSMAAEAP